MVSIPGYESAGLGLSPDSGSRLLAIPAIHSPLCGGGEGVVGDGVMQLLLETQVFIGIYSKCNMDDHSVFEYSFTFP